MHPLRLHYDKLLLVAALLLCGAGVAWSLRERNSAQRLLAERDETSLTSSLPESEQAVVAMDQSGHAWEEPDARVGADEPLGDIFTPPVRRSRDVLARTELRDRTEPAERANVPELLSVKQEPYRLQLAGYVGRPGSYRVILADAGRADTVLVQVGQRITDLGVTLVGFELRHTAVAENEAGLVHEAVAVAILKDEATGTDWVLDSRGPTFTGRLLAAIRVTSDDHEIWEGGEGDSLPAAGVTYRVEHIRSDPAQVMLVRITPGQLPESLNLKVTAGAAREPATTAPTLGEPPRVMAHRE